MIVKSLSYSPNLRKGGILKPPSDGIITFLPLTLNQRYLTFEDSEVSNLSIVFDKSLQSVTVRVMSSRDLHSEQACTIFE